VADDKLVYTYVPAMIRYYLDEDPLLPNVDTYRLDEADQLAGVLPRLDELVLKPVDGSGGYGLLIGPTASGKQLDDMREVLLDNPRGWIAQEVVQLSTSPTHIGSQLRPRHVDLRPFAVNDGERVWVVPGGLTRVALPEGSLVVNSSQGGGSKDTWVLAEAGGPRSSRPRQMPTVVLEPPAPGNPLDPGPSVPQAAQQQQGQQQQGQQPMSSWTC